MVALFSVVELLCGRASLLSSFSVVERFWVVDLASMIETAVVERVSAVERGPTLPVPDDSKIRTAVPVGSELR